MTHATREFTSHNNFKRATSVLVTPLKTRAMQGASHFESKGNYHDVQFNYCI